MIRTCSALWKWLLVAGFLAANLLSVVVLGQQGRPDKPENSDEYIPLTSYFNDSKRKFKTMHLDFFASELAKSHASRGYVVVFSSHNEKHADVSGEIDMIRRYLVRVKKINSNRFQIAYGGSLNKGMTNLFVVPKDVPPPIPFRRQPSWTLAETGKPVSGLRFCDIQTFVGTLRRLQESCGLMLGTW